MNNLKVFFLSFILVLIPGFALGVVSAQEEVKAPDPIEEVSLLDENIRPADLEISEPRLLPDSPFYFLKNLTRGIRSLLTFNPVRKVEVRMKFANEKLIETKKLIELKRNPEVVKWATENYQQEVEKIKTQADRIRGKAKENPRVEGFLDKFIHQQTLHQKVLDRLETQVPAQVFEKIKEARERHLERFQDVVLRLEDRKEKITEKLDKILEKQRGNRFKDFKNLEVLKALEMKVPEEARDAIKKAQENVLTRLKRNLEKMTSEDQERFKEYVERISGEKETQAEVMENLRTGLRVAPERPESIEEY